MKKNHIIILIAATFLFIMLFYFSRYQSILTIASFNLYKEQVKLFVQSHYIFSVLAYIGITALIAGIGLPLLIFVTLVGGYLFGIIGGTILTVIGATLGATAYFLTVRYFFGESLQERYQAKLKTFNHQIQKYGFFYLIVLHLIPTTPFFVSNLLAGLTKLRIPEFLLGTVLGIIPATAIYSYAGFELFQLQSETPFVPTLIKLLSALGLLAAIPLIAQFFIQRNKSKKTQ